MVYTDTGSRLRMEWPVASVTAERDAPVASEVTVTLAPTIAEPVLSVTVPRKLPVACPYANCPQQSTRTLHTATARINIFFISPYPSRQPRNQHGFQIQSRMQDTPQQFGGERKLAALIFGSNVSRRCSDSLSPRRNN